MGKRVGVLRKEKETNSKKTKRALQETLGSRFMGLI
tara:strand:- start:1211 stop:1318 length:108 start_codon:yes stop_codon:yes gene_type:complete